MSTQDDKLIREGFDKYGRKWTRINLEMFKGVRDGNGIRVRYDILARVEYVSFKP